MIHKETLGFECGYREVNVGLVGLIMGGLMFLIKKKIIPLLGIQGTMTHKKNVITQKIVITSTFKMSRLYERHLLLVLRINNDALYKRHK